MTKGTSSKAAVGQVEVGVSAPVALTPLQVLDALPREPTTSTVQFTVEPPSDPNPPGAPDLRLFEPVEPLPLSTLDPVVVTAPEDGFEASEHPPRDPALDRPYPEFPPMPDTGTFDPIEED